MRSALEAERDAALREVARLAAESAALRLPVLRRQRVLQRGLRRRADRLPWSEPTMNVPQHILDAVVAVRPASEAPPAAAEPPTRPGLPSPVNRQLYPVVPLTLREGPSAADLRAKDIDDAAAAHRANPWRRKSTPSGVRMKRRRAQPNTAERK